MRVAWTMSVFKVGVVMPVSARPWKVTLTRTSGMGLNLKPRIPGGRSGALNYVALMILADCTKLFANLHHCRKGIRCFLSAWAQHTAFGAATAFYGGMLMALTLLSD